jgi:hypothetical protein
MDQFPGLGGRMCVLRARLHLGTRLSFSPEDRKRLLASASHWNELLGGFKA